jgi:signal transduction histidine kinase
VDEMRERVDRLHAWGRLAIENEVLGAVPLDDCVDQALATLDGAPVITRAPLPTVRGSQAMLTQLYRELLGNAFEFSDGAPRVEVTCRARPGGPELGVRDAGIGLPREHAARALEPFERLHGCGRRRGAGMGLAIARRIVEEHRGRLWIESAASEGTRVLFTLPGV